MTTITKERIELFIKSPLENGLTRGEQMELARIALASLEAEPVSQTYELPQTQFEQVADLYEMQFDDGRTCAFPQMVQKLLSGCSHAMVIRCRNTSGLSAIMRLLLATLR